MNPILQIIFSFYIYITLYNTYVKYNNLITTNIEKNKRIFRMKFRLLMLYNNTSRYIQTQKKVQFVE